MHWTIENTAIIFLFGYSFFWGHLRLCWWLELWPPFYWRCQFEDLVCRSHLVLRWIPRSVICLGMSQRLYLVVTSPGSIEGISFCAAPPFCRRYTDWNPLSGSCMASMNKRTRDLLELPDLLRDVFVIFWDLIHLINDFRVTSLGARRVL